MLVFTLEGRLLVLIFTAVCAFQDFRSMRIDLRVFVLAGTSEAGMYLLLLLRGGTPDWRQVLAAGLAGLLLLLLSVLSAGAFGEGDALFFLLFGTAAGLRYQLAAACVSVFLAGAFSLCFLCGSFLKGRHAAGKKRFPFLPFAAVPVFYLLLKLQLQEGGAALP